MLDNSLSRLFRSAALLLAAGLVVALLLGFIEWLQGSEWESRSVLRAAYDANLLQARWFMGVDWGWRLHELLDRVPLLGALAALVPMFWVAGMFFDRR